MTEELKQAELQQSNEQQQYSDLQQAALEAGWDPNGKKDAKSFLLDGLQMRNEKITDLYKVTTEMREMMKQQERNLYEKARMDMEAERLAAIKAGDANKVYQLEQEQAQHNLRAEAAQWGTEFVRRNSEWYTGNSPEHWEMRDYCNRMDNIVGGNSVQNHFELLQQAMEKKFPQYFGLDDGSKASRPSAVEGSSPSLGKAPVSGKAKYRSIDDLPEHMRVMAQMFVKRKTMTFDEYVNEQIKAGNLK